MDRNMKLNNVPLSKWEEKSKHNLGEYRRGKCLRMGIGPKPMRIDNCETKSGAICLLPCENCNID